MTTPRLTIVTNEPARAVRYVLDIETAPSWCLIVTDPADVAALPDGTRFIGVFFETRKHRSALEWALIERRKRGGMLGLLMSEIEGLAAWRDRMAEAAGTLRVTSMRLNETGQGRGR